jgi:hypothetical protein
LKGTAELAAFFSGFELTHESHTDAGQPSKLLLRQFLRLTLLADQKTEAFRFCDCIIIFIGTIIADL